MVVATKAALYESERNSDKRREWLLLLNIGGCQVDSEIVASLRHFLFQKVELYVKQRTLRWNAPEVQTLACVGSTRTALRKVKDGKDRRCIM